MSSTYQQLTPVEKIDWNYRSDLTRLTIRFGAAPLSNDMRPVEKGFHKAQIGNKSTSDCISI
jgi:hypothetical protein